MLLVEAKHGVVDRQDRTAAIPEYGVYAFVREHLHEHVRAAHDDACEWMCGLIQHVVAVFQGGGKSSSYRPGAQVPPPVS